jgi:cytochrome c biogenesis protein CcdA/thiol-disulfide isomerase/thioredoxin
MIVLLGIAFLAGLVTAISPCVLPVLPILLAGGASGRKPLRIITGLIASFVVFTLFASWILDKLGLPQDLLRNLAIAALLVVAATLLVPGLGPLLERPFARLTRFRAGGGGFVLGISLGLVFVPCAGPLLAAVATNAARDHFTAWTILVALAYGVGAAIPMLAIALGGSELTRHVRSGASQFRAASGVVMAAVALALVFHLDDHLTQIAPGYLTFVQDKVENSKTAQRQLTKLRGGGSHVVATASATLQKYGHAPNFEPDGRWFNSKPLTVASLHGKVVLVDFWTYSCINCLRTLPHLKAWYAAYRKDGLEIVGVHTPEFAFEHVSSNVAGAINRLGIRYPVVQDNDYRTWTAYGNQYWPAEYLIDRRGEVRHIQFGEGDYDGTENAIRTLLGITARGGMTDVADLTPHDLTTPESYLGYRRLARYAGSPIARDRATSYRLPKRLPQNELAYGGTWKVGAERIVSGRDATLRLHFHAKKIYLVLGGRGRVRVLVGGKPQASVPVTAYKLYTLRDSSTLADALLELRFTPGVQAYAFTFG